MSKKERKKYREREKNGKRKNGHVKERKKARRKG